LIVTKQCLQVNVLDHLQLIKFVRPVPRGMPSVVNILGSTLLQPACSVSVSQLFFIRYRTILQCYRLFVTNCLHCLHYFQM